MGDFISLDGVYNLNGFDDNDIIKWNTMNSKIDQTFNEAIKGSNTN